MRVDQSLLGRHEDWFGIVWLVSKFLRRRHQKGETLRKSPPYPLPSQRDFLPATLYHLLVSISVQADINHVWNPGYLRLVAVRD